MKERSSEKCVLRGKELRGERGGFPGGEFVGEGVSRWGRRVF